MNAATSHRSAPPARRSVAAEAAMINTAGARRSRRRGRSAAPRPTRLTRSQSQRGRRSRRWSGERVPRERREPVGPRAGTTTSSGREGRVSSRVHPLRLFAALRACSRPVRHDSYRANHCTKVRPHAPVHGPACGLLALPRRTRSPHDRAGVTRGVRRTTWKPRAIRIPTPSAAPPGSAMSYEDGSRVGAPGPPGQGTASRAHGDRPPVKLASNVYFLRTGRA